MPKVSIIVPVYNVEKYIKDTLDGLSIQTLRDIEIILVDDGSTDSSGKICDEYAQKDNRFKVIHQKNGGVSVARNTGLDNATGEYIGFCDADDFPCPTLYEHLLNTLVDCSCDAVQTGFIVQNEKKKDFTFQGIKGDVTVKGAPEIIKWIFTKKVRNGTAVWEYMFKRSVLEGLTFPEGMTIGEDKLFILLALFNSKNVACYSGKEYIYVTRQSSAVHTKYNKKNLSAVKLAQKTAEMINSEHPQYSDYAKVNLYKVYLSNIRHIFCFDLKDAEMKFYYDEIISFLRQKSPDYLKIYLSSREAFELRLIRTSIPIYKLYIIFKKAVSAVCSRIK